jgi:hypothetical protein
MNVAAVEQHFKNCAPQVRATYDAILQASGKFGAVKEDPKKTSIHLVRKSAFAGIATRKGALLLTFKSDVDIPSSRITKHLQASACRWYLVTRLEKPADFDSERRAWLKQSYELS